jgi:hypothetical protein
MEEEIKHLEFPMNNPSKAIEFLLARGNLPILFWLKKEILDVPVDREIKNLCKYAARVRLLESQRPDGSWTKKRMDVQAGREPIYHLIETIKNIARLYDLGCSLDEERIQKAIDFLFSVQTPEGDFRGGCFNEYSPTYNALIIEVLCRFGLDNDPRVQKAFRWFVSHRQHDGGWAIPCRTIDREKLRIRYRTKNPTRLAPVKPDKSQPFSHLITGMVLRAFAESPTWRKSKEAIKAGELLLSRFFQEDVYDDRRQAYYWEEMNYPFWATDILSSLDALSKIGFNSYNEKIQLALEWLLNKQNSQGFWESGNKKGTLEDSLWVTFSVLIVLKRFGIFQA